MFAMSGRWKTSYLKLGKGVISKNYGFFICGKMFKGVYTQQIVCITRKHGKQVACNAFLKHLFSSTITGHSSLY